MHPTQRSFPSRLQAKALLAATGLASALCCQPVLAQITYDNRAAFEADAPEHFNYDFNAGTTATILSTPIGHVAGVSTVGGNAFGAVSGGSLWGSVAGTKEAFSTLRFDFVYPLAVYGFGFDDMDLNGAEWAIVDVTFSGGLTQRYARTTLVPFEPVFFGVASAVPLLRVEVFSDDSAAGLAPGSRANFLDNVVVSISPVPEASNRAMLLSGLACLAWLAVRSRKRR